MGRVVLRTYTNGFSKILIYHIALSSYPEYHLLALAPMILIFFLAGLLFVVPCFAFDNLMVVTIDTLRADYAGFNGSSKVKTPNMDSLAAQGLIFKNTVAPAPITMPSHATLFTGLLPPEHGVRDNGGFILDDRFITLAEVLKSHHLSTAAFIGSFALDSRFGLDQGFDLYDDRFSAAFSKVTMPERRAKDVVDAALQWLSRQKRPWFVWIHFFDPHFPYEAPVPYDQKYSHDKYAGEVAYVDDQLGRLLEFLRKTGQQNETLIVITSDHGESLGEHGETTHSIFAYESTLRVPLLMAPLQPKVIETRVRLVDVSPTILELMNASFPDRVSGKSLIGIINGQKGIPSDSYFEAMSMNFNSQWAPLHGFYSGVYKYISLPIPELYDLSKDPKEAKNLCTDKELCSQWAARYAAFSRSFPNIQPVPSPVDTETTEKLRALGYISSRHTGSAKKKYSVYDDPKNLIYLHNRQQQALTYYQEGNLQKAIDALQSIIKDRPDYGLAYLDAALMENQRGAPERAVDLLRAAKRHGLNTPQADCTLGFYLVRAGKSYEAIRHLKSAIQHYPEQVDCWNSLGLAYSAMDSNSDALSAFQTSLKLDPSNSVALTNLGMLYFYSAKYDQAISTIEQALTIKSNDPNLLTTLGLAYAGKNQWSRAIGVWEDAIEKDRTNFDAMWNLALAYKKRNPDRARELLLEFQQNAPPSQYGQHLKKIPALLEQ